MSAGNGPRIAIIGGGPAGSLLAILLAVVTRLEVSGFALRESRQSFAVPPRPSFDFMEEGVIFRGPLFSPRGSRVLPLLLVPPRGETRSVPGRMESGTSRLRP